MADCTFRGLLGRYRRQYAAMQTKQARKKRLDALQQLYPIERKYLIKLLNGKRNYRPHRGRGASYPVEELRPLVKDLWEAGGYPCAEYFHARLQRLLDEWQAEGHIVPDKHIRALNTMSISTLGRILKQLPHPFGRRANKRSGSQRALSASIPACAGHDLPEDRIGTCQVDTVALCGGRMSESFFYIATLTDAHSQWFECAPAWNHSARATSQAMQHIHARLPFDIHHLHPDNGSEFINHLFIQAVGRLIPGVAWSRSRPYHKNDNCRIEQKNGSVIRRFLGDIRLDDVEQSPALERVCRDISLYINLFEPCKKLVSKKRQRTKKGIRYIKRYDQPQTPLDRLVHIHGTDDPRIQAYLLLREQSTSIQLLRSIHKQIGRIFRQAQKMKGGGGRHAATPLPSRPPSRPLSVSMHLTDAL